MSFWSRSNDFDQRDDSVKINSYTTVLKRAAVPHELFATYWRDVHGPLCSRLPGLDWYVQHHFNREQDAHLRVGADGIGPLQGYVLDGIVEIGFASAGEQKSFKAASPLLFVDEQNVFEETFAYDLPHGSTSYRDRLPAATPNGTDSVDRLHIHFHAKSGQEKAFQSYLKDEVVSSLTKSEEFLKLRLHLPEPHQNAAPNPLAPHVKHDASLARVTMAMLEIAFEKPLKRRQFLESAAFRATLNSQADVVSHITPFGVSGVYTFVRDSELTVAGLRGSRAAEIITQLAAVNRITPDVAKLFVASGK